MILFLLTTACQIAFVDSDDFLDADEDGNIVSVDAEVIHEEALTSRQALERFNPYKYPAWHYHMLWNKLYRAEIFDGLRFNLKVMVGCEDIFLGHYAFGKCRRVAVTNQKLYVYVNRSTNYCNTRAKSPILFVDRVMALLDRRKFLVEHDIPETAEAVLQDAYMSLRHILVRVNYFRHKDILKAPTFEVITHLLNTRSLKDKVRVLIVLALMFSCGTAHKLKRLLKPTKK